ncbi:MAG: UDP-N-acetylmuramoyl-L-alanine--D-glutamate ligase [Endomicrobium sp.]|jgi:UDP-N-acetylmuramoylalanine--D-glutamate ligase|nr:UDP-N-acetylmuramoyl-L-alanine--D-glutamate ligase [Endomicrobium sp.]
MKRNIGILGLGKSGIAVANLAIRLGYNVFASDDSKEIKTKNLNNKIVKELGGHSDKILSSDIIIKSPGINLNIPILKKARRKNIKIISELAFSLENSKYRKIIAITGTNGKTTTTDLISKIVKATHKDSIVSGNIGYPLSYKALKTTRNTFITIELSSYQLEDTPYFKPNVSILLNVFPDHLEHHKTINAYIKAKENILINQKFRDFAIINYDNQICRKISKKTKAKIIFFSKNYIKNGVFYKNGDIVINIKDKNVVIKPKINIIGMHNIENILAATAVTYILGTSSSIIEKIISKYKGVKHRIEFIRTLNGVNYYNDSKSTNVDSTRVALESFNKDILLIMGGRDKGSAYTPIKELIKQRVKSILLIGEASNKIKKDLGNCTTFIHCNDIENAVKQVFKIAVGGDTVLLSPACASFDQFKNFEERGEVFRKVVWSLDI